MHTIRAYRPADAEQVADCIIELQDFERALEPDRVEGATIAMRYLNDLLDLCQKKQGEIFVAEAQEKVVGFVSVRIEQEIDLYLSNLTEYAYISDVVVLSAYRGIGIGKELLERAEEHARRLGAKMMKIGVLAKNQRAWSVYHAAGFRDYEIVLLKKLADD